MTSFLRLVYRMREIRDGLVDFCRITGEVAVIVAVFAFVAWLWLTHG